MKKLIYTGSFVVIAMALAMVTSVNQAQAGYSSGCPTYRVYNSVGYSYNYCIPSYAPTPVYQAPVYQNPGYQNYGYQNYGYQYPASVNNYNRNQFQSNNSYYYPTYGRGGNGRYR